MLSKQPAGADLLSCVGLATGREWLILQTLSILCSQIVIPHEELIE